MRAIFCFLLSATLAIASPLRDHLGLCVKFAQGEPAANIGNLVDLGLGVVRDSPSNNSWATMEPTAWSYLPSFPPEFQARLDYYKTNGIKLIYLQAYKNPSHSDPFNALAFAKCAIHVAKLLKAQGWTTDKFVIELWNEPHNFDIGPTFGGPWHGADPCPWLNKYVQIANTAIDQMWAYDPTVRLIGGDDMWVLAYHMIDKGIDIRLRGLVVHPYKCFNPIPGIPEREPVDANTDWCQPYQVVDSTGSYASGLANLKAKAFTKNQWGAEIHVTELGWTSATFLQEEVAAFLVRSAIISEAGGVKSFCWFSSWDGPDGPMGLVDNGGNKRWQYHGYKTLVAQLGSYSLKQKVIGSSTTGLQAYLFDGPLGSFEQRLCVWNIERAIQVRFSGVTNPQIAIFDMFGKQLIPQTDQGSYILSASPSPIYVIGIPQGTPFTLTVL